MGDILKMYISSFEYINKPFQVQVVPWGIIPSACGCHFTDSITGDTASVFFQFLIQSIVEFIVNDKLFFA